MTAAKVGTLDTTMMLNGLYALRLTSTTSEGSASAIIDVSVERNLKVGNFTVSFTDLAVPVSGLPIEVVRTYDSRDKTQGDFGVGWTVSLRDIRVETSGTLGRAWRQAQQPGFWPTYCVQQARPRFVTVPDGQGVPVPLGARARVRDVQQGQPGQHGLRGRGRHAAR